MNLNTIGKATRMLAVHSPHAPSVLVGGLMGAGSLWPSSDPIQIYKLPRICVEWWFDWHHHAGAGAM